VWVVARASDALLGFSSSELPTDLAHALVADVQVGEAPVGLAIIDRGTRIVVTDSNRFEAPRATAALTVINTAAALAGQPAVLGSVAAGFFPREEAIEPDVTTLLVTNTGSHQLEAVDITALP
jgi:DNA-binding beta-propeller fold protein YncE